MNRTFTTKTINGRAYQFLTLPNSNLFKFEIVNTMGAHVERVINAHTGKNVYGLSHLVEHLGFRAPKDYTTEELMRALKTEGTYNASTNHERINYWFKTTMQRVETAVRLVCNYALNDLTNIPEDEFQTEKKVVYNEAKRYADDDQTMFHFNVEPTLCGLHPEDNIIGIPETIDTFTLEDAQMIKRIFLAQGQQIFNVIYDPTVKSEEDVVAVIEAELERFPAPLSTHAEIADGYNGALPRPAFHQFIVENESEQVMTALAFDTMNAVNLVAARIGNDYLARLSSTSLTDLIREQNGLTYGISLYDDNVSYTPYAFFVCDVSRGTEGLLMELFEQSVEESVANFDEQAYTELMSTVTLKRTLALVDQQKYESIFWTSLWFPNVTAQVKDELATNMDLAYEALNEKLASYEAVKGYLEVFLEHVKGRKYGKVTNFAGA